MRHACEGHFQEKTIFKLFIWTQSSIECTYILTPLSSSVATFKKANNSYKKPHHHPNQHQFHIWIDQIKHIMFKFVSWSWLFAEKLSAVISINNANIYLTYLLFRLHSPLLLPWQLPSMANTTALPKPLLKSAALEATSARTDHTNTHLIPRTELLPKNKE